MDSLHGQDFLILKETVLIFVQLQNSNISWQIPIFQNLVSLLPLIVLSTCVGLLDMLFLSDSCYFIVCRLLRLLIL